MIIRPVSNPIKPSGHLQILRGNLAPGGAVAKITGKEGLVFVGKARVFDKEFELDSALKKNEIKHGENLVLIVRYEGPKGGPGMPEQLKASAAIIGAGLTNVALVTDGRYSGASHGFIVGHVVPEAAGEFSVPSCFAINFANVGQSAVPLLLLETAISSLSQLRLILSA